MTSKDMDQASFKKAVAAGFDVASEGYDRPAMRFFDNSAQELVRGLALKGDERVLDACAGTGKVAVAVAKRVPRGEVLGIDLSEGMLRRAAERAKAAGVANASFQQGDVDTADFPAGRFDGLTCGFGVFFWSEMEKSLSRLLASVRPGGFAAVSSFAAGSFEPHSNICLKMFARYGVKLPDSYTWHRMDHPDKVKKILEASGLKDVSCRRFQAGYDLETAADWWDLIRFTGFRTFLNQLSPDQAARYQEEFLREVESSRKGGNIPLHVEVILSTAVK